jgi:hypothetical protein
MRNTADVTGKPIAVLLQFISRVSAINPLVAFYDILGGKREVFFFYFVPNTTRNETFVIYIGIYKILSVFHWLRHRSLPCICYNHNYTHLSLRLSTNSSSVSGTLVLPFFTWLNLIKKRSSRSSPNSITIQKYSDKWNRMSQQVCIQGK